MLSLTKFPFFLSFFLSFFFFFLKANLHVAVELGQRLLKRNQALLEEQVGMRRSIAEKEVRILELQALLDRAQEQIQGNDAQATIERLSQEKMDAERQRDVNLDRIVDLQRLVDSLKKVFFCFEVFFCLTMVYVYAGCCKLS